MSKIDCPRCSRGELILGFIADYSHASIRVSTWVEGHPERAFLTGTKAPPEKSIPVGTFRCSNCGYLESYARAEFAATRKEPTG
jgi:hypothetical protein